MAVTICHFNKIGFCEFGERCSMKLSNMVCEKSQCKIFYCDFRHTKSSLYFKKFNRCMFKSSCKYNCEKDTLENVESDKNLYLKIKSNEESLENFKIKNNTIIEQLDFIKKEIIDKDKQIKKLSEKKI